MGESISGLPPQAETVAVEELGCMRMKQIGESMDLRRQKKPSYLLYELRMCCWNILGNSFAVDIFDAHIGPLEDSRSAAVAVPSSCAPNLRDSLPGEAFLNRF